MKGKCFKQKSQDVVYQGRNIAMLEIYQSEQSISKYIKDKFYRKSKSQLKSRVCKKNPNSIPGMHATANPRAYKSQEFPENAKINQSQG